MDEQQQTVTELKSKNDNLDLSEIIINYTAAYTAYQSSLQAAGRLGEMSLLNYI
jgi:flagellar hook-associated protein 3 FlgL